MNPTRHNNSLFARLAGAALAAVFLATPALGQSSPTKVDDAVKQEFRELVRRRDQLARKLAAADRKAAEGIKGEKDPVAIHAEQQSLEHELDLVQLRLETMSVRHELPLPEVPTPESIEAKRQSVAARAAAAFDGGRDRARQVLARDAKRMLASIDFGGFLASNGN